MRIGFIGLGEDLIFRLDPVGAVSIRFAPAT